MANKVRRKIARTLGAHSVYVMTEQPVVAKAFRHNCRKADKQPIMSLLCVGNYHFSRLCYMPGLVITVVVFDAVVFVSAAFIDRIEVVHRHTT